MPDVLRSGFAGGLVSSRDRSALALDELQTAESVYYKQGDPRTAWKIPGRIKFDATVQGSAFKGLKLLQFDSGGTDILLGMSGSALYSATPGERGVFSSLASGRSAQSDKLHAVHLNNRWFITTGNDSNTVIESDGTDRVMGMIAPQAPPTVAASALAGNTNRADGSTGNSGFSSVALAYDANDETFAYATRQTSGSSTCTWTWSGSNTDSNRRLVVAYRLAGAQNDTEDETGTDAGFVVTVKFEISEDNGDTFTTVYQRIRRTFTPQVVEIPNGVSANNNVTQFRATLTYSSGTSPATLRIYEVLILNGSRVSPFSTTTGHRYAIAELSEDYGIQSAISDTSQLVQLSSGSSHDAVTLTFPSALNAITTHWVVYRNPDGGSVPKQLGRIAIVPVAESTYVDDFNTWASTEQPLPIVPLKIIRSGDTELVLPRDTKPPQYTHIGKFKGQVVGVNGRLLYFSEPGFPESVPEINVIRDFDLEERDELVGTAQVGDSLWVGMTRAVVFLDDLPIVVDGALIQPPKRVLSGYPGVVGSYAFTTYTESGIPRLAWVSRHGIYVTDGQQAQLLTRDLDWASEVDEDNLDNAVLHWDQRRELLQMAHPASGSTTNDRVMYIHMGPDHRKENGYPRITAGYGKIGAVTSGEVSGTYRTWSAHVSDGRVYTEWTGQVDESNAYDTSGTIPLTIKTGRIFGPDRALFGVATGSVRHTDHPGKTASLTITTGREDGGIEQSVTKSISLSGNRGTEFFVGRAGEYVELTLTNTDKVALGLHEFSLKVNRMGQAGKVLTT